MFEVRKHDGLARLGELKTRHGKVKTPALLPVINPNMSKITTQDMKEEFGAQMVITNSYIIRKSKTLKETALEKGVHELLGTEIPVMTDSGTFQTYVYSDVQIDPKTIVEFQRDIGSDVGTLLDLFTTPDMAYTKAKNDIRENLKRGEESIALKGDMLLAGTIQGGIFPDLRKWCAEEMSKLDFDFHPVGGVVPLLEGYRYTTLLKMLLSAKEGLNPSRPVHLFGCGHPMVFAVAALAGVDFFDSSSYIKYAKDDRLIFVDSSRRLSEIQELPCSCPICSRHTVRELREMEKPERVILLARHNLHVMFQEMRAVRDAIAGEFLQELVEQRCRSHPALAGVLEVLADHAPKLELQTSISRRTAFFELSEYSLRRPVIQRLSERILSRWQPFAPFYIRLDDTASKTRKPYNTGFSWFVNKQLRERPADGSADHPLLGMVDSKMGYLPLGLGEIYPIAQSLMSELPVRGEGFVSQNEEFLKSKGIILIEQGDNAPKDLAGKIRRSWGKSLKKKTGLSLREFHDTFNDFRSLQISGSRTSFFDLLMLVSVLDYQFGPGSFEAIFLNRPPMDPLPPYGFQRFTVRELEDARISLVKSKNTGKIRNIMAGHHHLLSMHAHDGFFLLKMVAGLRLLEHTGRHTITVDSETAVFNRKGKSVFAKFVKDVDPEIRPGDEVIVVDEKGKPAAVGTALLPVPEMLAFDQGMAVKVREGLSRKKKKK